ACGVLITYLERELRTKLKKGNEDAALLTIQHHLHKATLRLS
ncbi:MAG: hypothetical protein ACI8Q3_002398, partial [Marinomonas primoryensis]